MGGLTLLRERWHGRFSHLVRNTRSELLISSPYVSQKGVETLVSNLSCTQRQNIRLTMVTSLSPMNICQGSTDPAALRALAANSREMALFHLPRLHAKAYIADGARAILTSGNLTAAGLFRNYEYGCEITEPALVARIRQDIKSYGELGARVTAQQLDSYCDIAKEVRSAFRKRLATAGKAAIARFDRTLRVAEDELVRLRLLGGATHTVFAKTIVYLLERHGALETIQIHPLIQAIHPDLCDDTIDRVIDGKRFGKKWKHAVRTAQQQLKKKRMIRLAGRKWTLGVETVE